MGQLDHDPIPPHAITLWLTDHDIVALLPMTAGGKPYMMKFPLSESGLMRALELLRKRKHEVLTPTEAQVFDVPKTQPQVKVSARRQQFLNETTQEQRDAAQALLRKLGMLKS